MIKTIAHNEDINRLYLMVVVSIPPLYRFIKDDGKTLKIGNDKSSATIRINEKEITISGANNIVKECFASIKENIDNQNKQKKIGKRIISTGEKCGQPICTCGLCSTFFNK